MPSYRSFSVDVLPNHQLAITFPYDTQLLQVIRTVPGRRWNKDRKHWAIPSVSLRAFEQTAARNQVRVIRSARVQEALNLGARRKAEGENAKLDDSPLEIPSPTEAFPFQRAGIRFAHASLKNFKGVLIADDMGLGKTYQTLALIAKNNALRHCLVIVPATLKYNWAEQIDQHFPQLSYTIIDGGPARREEQWNSDSRIKIANYELLRIDPDVREIQWDLAVADEVTRLKNFRAQVTKAAHKLNRRYSIGLSGIPVENRLEELHSVMEFCLPGLLGPGWLFFREHVVIGGDGSTRYKGVDQVRDRIRPHYIRRRKAEVLKDLPPKVYNDYWVELTAKEWKIYETIEDEIVEQMEDNPKLKAANILTMMLRLKQVTDDYHLLDVEGEQVSSKMQAVGDILEASGGRKVVFFTQFSQMARRVVEQYGLPVIDGAVKVKDRQEIIAAFQRNPDIPALVSTEAGAYGLTLTAADIVVHIDAPWNPARLRQREDRLHRIGQLNSVQVVNLMARRTVDEHVRAILHQKLDLVKMVLDEDADDLAGFSVTRGDLMRLLRRRDD